MPDVLHTLSPEAIAKALEGLPAPQAQTLERTLDVPGVGTVLFQYRRHVHRRGKGTHAFWVVVGATVAGHPPSG
jgi:hypothetical protein